MATVSAWIAQPTKLTYCKFYATEGKLSERSSSEIRVNAG